jgi:hypothetical protein
MSEDIKNPSADLRSTNVDEEAEVGHPNILLVPKGADVDTKIDLPFLKDAPLLERIVMACQEPGRSLVEVNVQELIFLSTAGGFIPATVSLLMGAPDGEYNQNWFLYRTQFGNVINYDQLLSEFEGSTEPTPVTARTNRKDAVVRKHSLTKSDQVKFREDQAAELEAEPEFRNLADPDLED